MVVLSKTKDNNSNYRLSAKSKTLFKYFLLSGCVLSSSYSMAAAFLLNEQNTSGLGNAYAGRAAIAEDASTSFYNPAGLVMMNNHQVVASLVNPLPKFDFTSKTVTRATPTNVLLGNVSQGKISDDAGNYVPLPAFHLAGILDNNWYYGFSITAPFGLATEYSKTSRMRYFGTKSSLETIDINPNVAYKFNNQWSVGVGISARYAEAILESQIDSASFTGGAENMALDGTGENKADGWGVGYNFGILYQPSSKTRVGLAFRSKIKHDVEGKLKVRAPSAVLAIYNAGNLIDQRAEASVTLPEVVSISAFQVINTDWDIMGDITFTNWHRFKKLVIKYPDTALADNRVEEKFKDVFKLSVGANYKYDSKLKFKFGLSYDDSPVDKKHRNIRIPDSDRYWLSTGAQYKFDKNFTIDAAYTYIIVKSASVDERKTSNPVARITGDYDSGIHLLGIQAAYNFV